MLSFLEKLGAAENSRTWFCRFKLEDKMYEKKYFLAVTKLCVQACLFFLFLFLFAIPDIRRFKAKEVMVVKLMRRTKGMKAPSVTIVGRNNPNLAWKNNSGSTLDKLCGTYFDNQTQQCIEENTLDQSDVIKEVLIGNKSTTKKVLEENRTNSSISYLQSLKAEFSRTMYGMTYTFDKSVEISTEKRITLCLAFNKSYSIFIHDKEFFLLNSVPSISGQSCKKLHTPV